MIADRGGWRYYNHALLPNVGPHEEPDLQALSDKKSWISEKGRAFFASWVTDFDCEMPTEWWYCIKDEPFDISKLKAKRRYEIIKGKRYFEVRRINPSDYAEEMYRVQQRAYEAYPEKKRPHVEYEVFLNGLKELESKRVYGAFGRENNALCGYAYLSVYEEYADFNVLRTIPAEEKKGINAAIVAHICEDFHEQLKGNYYISDGSRSILHETNFQEYLEKYFGFRKAYCKLHLHFPKHIAFMVRLLKSFRGFPLPEKVKAVLLMTEICGGKKRGLYERYFKRIFDLLIAGGAIVILSPVLLIVALLVRIKLGSPVIFRQPRPGKGKKLFHMYKFRTMTDERDKTGKLLSDDKRMIPYGKKLRDSGLDELPELFNVLKGDMSLVGPRPQLVRDMVFMTEEQNKRHDICQGLTGLAQVNGRNAISWEDKLTFDLKYRENISFIEDLKILIKTIKVVLKKEGATAEGMSTSEDFGDYLLRTGKVTQDEYDEKQQEAEKLIQAMRKG